MSNVVLPAVQNENGHLFVTSQNIAEVFNKNHAHVLRDIRSLLETIEENRRVNFQEVSVTQRIGATNRTYTSYKLSRDGLVFLIMGYTGKNAQKFKWAYIDEFNRMEQVLRGQYVLPRKTLTVEQQQAIRQAIAKRCKDSSSSYQTVYKALYNAFRIPRYTELLQSDFDKAMELISGANLNVSVCRNIAPTLPEGALVLNASQVELLRITVYHFTELMTKPMKIAYQILSACDSPYAGRMYEANVCIPLYALKRFLEDRGIDTTKPKTLAG